MILNVIYHRQNPAEDRFRFTVIDFEQELLPILSYIFTYPAYLDITLSYPADAAFWYSSALK
jgi:hypothetical protein